MAEGPFVCVDCGKPTGWVTRCLLTIISEPDDRTQGPVFPTLQAKPNKSEHYDFAHPTVEEGFLMTAVTPFKIAISDDRLSWIGGRVRCFDWESFPDAGGWSAGIAKQALRTITDRWIGGYDWRAEEAVLNELPQFRCEMDTGTLHFIHIQTPGGASRPPVLLLHGWPGSFAEFRDSALRLAYPERFGGDAADALDLVIPSLPGFGFSGKPAGPIGTRTVARTLHDLMTQVLGYERYIAQGGDWGSTTASWLAHDYPDACVALHVNMMIMGHAGVTAETDEERQYQKLQMKWREADGGYSHIQRTRPQTLGFALQDSPVGTAAWILEKFAMWSDVPWKDGAPDLLAGYSIDHLLTNVMLYVATGTITTSAWIYLGNSKEKAFQLEHPITVPTAMASFPDPLFKPPPRSLPERSYNIVRWTDMPRGGHFAAMEQPDLFADDVRAFALTVV